MLELSPYPYELERIILVDITQEIELKIQEITMLLFQFQADYMIESPSLGLSLEPSMNPTLFLTKSAMSIAWLYDG